MREVQRVPRDEFRRRRFERRTDMDRDVDRQSERDGDEAASAAFASRTRAASCVLTVSWSTVCPIF